MIKNIQKNDGTEILRTENKTDGIHNPSDFFCGPVPSSLHRSNTILLRSHK
jgi:hypothetical protein